MTQPATALAPLLSWAQLPAPAKALKAARTRLEAGHTGDRVRLPMSLTAPERAQIGRLLGLPWAASDKDVSLGLLRAACARAGSDLEELLGAVGGPLRNLPAEKADAAACTRRTLGEAQVALVAAGAPEPVAALVLNRRWLGRPAAPEFRSTLTQLCQLLEHLPAGGTLLANVAQDLFGDPHALDRDRVLGRAAARTLSADRAHHDGGDAAALAAAADAVGTAAGWRTAWAGAGVACDQLSSTVLVLNVAVPGPGTAATLLRAAATCGEPLWLTARTLRGDWPPVPGSMAGTLVRVCENPSVIEAAVDVLGASCPPMVCTYGRPSLAAWELLTGLLTAGAHLEVSADRDPAGADILKDLLARLPSSKQWLPEADGLFEEQRLPSFLVDLETRSTGPRMDVDRGPLESV